ncbi:putative Polysaccharide biosynthesis protein C-terminal domain-containing protein [Candidatus Magnetomoraceae bacterium gMMP-1]
MSQIDIDRKVKKGLFWAGILRGGGSGLKIIFTIILARILDPKDFGIMAIASVVVFYADNLTSFGFSNALIQRKNITSTYINITFITNFTISIFLCLICIIFSSAIADLFKAPESQAVIEIFSLTFLLTTFFDIPITLLKKEINFKASEIFRLARTLLQSFIAVILALLGFKVWALVYGQLAGLFIISIAIVWYTGWHPSFEFNLKKFKDLANFGIWDFLRNQIGYLGKYGPQFIVSRFIGIAELGFFEKAVSTSGMIVDQVSMNMNNIMFSAFSSIQGDENAIKETFKHYLTLRTAIGFPVVTGLALISPYFVPIVLGDKWNNAIIPIQIISISEGIRMLIGLLSVANVAIGKYARHTIYKTITNVLLLIFCLFFLKWGIIGICIALVIADLLSLCASFQVFQSKLDDFNIRSMLGSLRSAFYGCLVMICIFIILQKLFFYTITIYSMFGLIICSAITYSLCMLRSKHHDLQIIKNNIFEFIKKIMCGLRRT